jgi:hypothetical protein
VCLFARPPLPKLLPPSLDRSLLKEVDHGDDGCCI